MHLIFCVKNRKCAESRSATYHITMFVLMKITQFFELQADYLLYAWNTILVEREINRHTVVIQIGYLVDIFSKVNNESLSFQGK